MKKIFCYLFAFFMASCLSAVESNATVNNDGSGKLIVATNAVYKPFEYKDGGKIVGFDIDLISEIAKRVGFEYEIKNVDFDNLSAELSNGSVDMAIAAIDITDDRKTRLDFSKPYFKNDSLLLKSSQNTAINSPADLAGKLVGVEEGTTLHEILPSVASGVTIQAFASNYEGFMSLRAGLVDAFFVDAVVAKEYIALNPNAVVEFFKVENPGEGMGIAFVKGKHTELISKINEAISTIVTDGTYEKLLEKYGL
ncbi:transporter substrate-binding domain-containing protein [Campylobacter corcagiensis]|uniref:Transporter substrate-binding domain-containing protein n=1 Tax=Campylobacter corcagiensis TaxID=1448857 RepID=A0A7M1LE11_9BACT|nr:transporter substrate-binding domain-containing protein [Campylobacter corcagiensis]QKF65157.1 amino acid ABC transporter, periplasmic arginine/lysine/histidine-binding protein [Campylobacter corcagiensis]QOQ86700.1 transporter substrate-binding domain-containing protein [Campylobacter corcagiensis]